MKKLVLAALLASFATGSIAAEKINFGVSATYPPFESLDASNKIVASISIWQPHYASKCRQNVLLPIMLSIVLSRR